MSWEGNRLLLSIAVLLQVQNILVFIWVAIFVELLILSTKYCHHCEIHFWTNFVNTRISSHNHYKGRSREGPCYMGSIGGSKGGPEGTCPETILDCAFATWVLKIFLLTFTRRKFFFISVGFMILQCAGPLLRCISAFFSLVVGVKTDPFYILAVSHFQFPFVSSPPQTVTLLKRFSAALFRYLIITLVVVLVGFTGVTTRKLFLRNMQST